MTNKRLKRIKNRIVLEDHKSGHLIVTSKIKGCRFKRLTNITSNLSMFERNVVLIHMYKLIDYYYFDTPNTAKTVRDKVGQENYAGIFGGPWLIQKQEDS